MEYILYYNHPEQGYGFYDESAGFPEKYRQKIGEVCNSTSEPVPGVPAVALRGEPLPDCYLLSVIFRQPDGNGVQHRGVNIIVSYLLTDEEADEAFQRPAQLLRNTESLSMEYLRQQNIRFSESAASQTVQTMQIIGNAQLLNAATYSGSQKKQAFFSLETAALPEVAAMLNLLPPKLRKKTSFHTGLQSARESVGIYANFGSKDMMANVLRGSFDGGQGDTNKYVYHFDAEGSCHSNGADKTGIQNGSRLLSVMKQIPCPEVFGPLLLDEIDSWDALERLLELDCEDKLSAALKLANREQLLDALQDPSVPKAQLQMIQQAADRLRMQDVYQTAKRALHAFAVPEKQKSAFSAPKPPHQSPIKPEPALPHAAPEEKKTESQPVQPPQMPQSTQPPQILSRTKPGFLWKVLKLVVFAWLILFGGWLLKGLLIISTVQTGTVLTLVLQIPNVLGVARLFSLLGVTAAVSAIVTAWCCKRSRKKKKAQSSNKE